MTTNTQPTDNGLQRSTAEILFHRTQHLEAEIRRRHEQMRALDKALAKRRVRLENQKSYISDLKGRIIAYKEEIASLQGIVNAYQEGSL